VATSRRLADAHKAAERLPKIAELTSELPEDSHIDARLRDRLELAGDAL